MNAGRSIAAPALGLLLALAAAAPGRATNGKFLTSYGAETAGRGGANIALSDRSLGLNSNPAGICQLQGRHFSANLSLLDPSLTFTNSGNDSVEADSRTFPLPAFAYVRSGNDTPWAFGYGLVAQGGMGATFQGLNTLAGTRDLTRSEVRFVTFSPTVAYSFSDDMALGCAHELNAEARIEHIRRGHAGVHEASLGSHDLGEMGEEGYDIVLDLGFNFFDARYVEFRRLALFPNFPRGFLRNDAKLRHGLRGVRLDFEPDAEPAVRRPDRGHLGS